MCGISGRIRYDAGSVGSDIVELAACMRHRGPDSTGFAVYGVPRERGYVVRGYLDDRGGLDDTLQAFADITREHGSRLLADPTWDQSGQQHVLWRAEVDEVDALALHHPLMGDLERAG